MPSRSINDLQPIFRARVAEWLNDCAIHGLDILVTCTLRSRAEQDTLYTYGRTVKNPNGPATSRYPLGRPVTNAKAGESAHQYGFALDFVPMTNGKPDWSGTSPLWDTAISLAKARNMESLRPLESAHLQLPNWKSYVQ